MKKLHTVYIYIFHILHIIEHLQRKDIRIYYCIFTYCVFFVFSAKAFPYSVIRAPLRYGMLSNPLITIKILLLMLKEHFMSTKWNSILPDHPTRTFTSRSYPRPNDDWMGSLSARVLIENMEYLPRTMDSREQTKNRNFEWNHYAIPHIIFYSTNIWKDRCQMVHLRQWEPEHYFVLQQSDELLTRIINSPDIMMSEDIPKLQIRLLLYRQRLSNETTTDVWAAICFRHEVTSDSLHSRNQTNLNK